MIKVAKSSAQSVNSIEVDDYAIDIGEEYLKNAEIKGKERFDSPKTTTFESLTRDDSNSSADFGHRSKSTLNYSTCKKRTTVFMKLK